jgi:hypothetical protein
MVMRLKGKKARRIRQRITSETQVRVREIKSLLTDNRDRAESIKDVQSAREKRATRSQRRSKGTAQGAKEKRRNEGNTECK